MRLRVKVKNPMWPYRATFAKHIIIPEFEIYEGELKKMKHNWRFPKGEFILVNGDQSHIIHKDDVIEAWRQR